MHNRQRRSRAVAEIRGKAAPVATPVGEDGVEIETMIQKDPVAAVHTAVAGYIGERLHSEPNVTLRGKDACVLASAVERLEEQGYTPQQIRSIMEDACERVEKLIGSNLATVAAIARVHAGKSGNKFKGEDFVSRDEILTGITQAQPDGLHGESA